MTSKQQQNETTNGSKTMTLKKRKMSQKRFCDCAAEEIIRFGDGSGPEHSIVSINIAKRTALIENMDVGGGSRQTVPIDDETVVWARPSRFTGK